MSSKRPRIGIPSDVRLVGDAPMHMVGEKYIAAVIYGAGGLPVILPALGPGAELPMMDGALTAEDLLDGIDGLLFPGSHSNLAPEYYDRTAKAVGPFDPQRDATTLPLLRAAIARDLPVFAVCRGFQELNVVCGGTLYPEVHAVEGYMDHREDASLPRLKRYDPVHELNLTKGGWLAQLLGTHTISVNSLHGQGVATVGENLTVEGVAPDGLVEAIRMPDKRFIVGVQWHPEWKCWERPVSRQLFAAFGAAARATDR